MSKNRSIFEDVHTDEKHVAAPLSLEGAQEKSHRALQIWLSVLFALVAVMIVIGGLTRLTDSGLSITEWAPFRGALPPLSHADWIEAFEKYKKIPEYVLQNEGMSLGEFQFIFWWEWGHRQLGRVIGLVWALGFLWFGFTKSLPAGWLPRLLTLGALGGLQGAVGWWMVYSGLQGEMLDVASYRLAIHLGLAFVIFGVIVWFMNVSGQSAVSLMQSRRRAQYSLKRLTTVLLLLTFVQILLGALVAGIDAGRTYPDWPLMAGQFFPPEPFGLSPIWRNFFEDEGLVQFMHRMMGYVVFAFGLFLFVRTRKNANLHIKSAFTLVKVMLIVQMGLGIVTVLYSAPLHAAIAHQIGAILLWVLILNAKFKTHYPPAQSLA